MTRTFERAGIAPATENRQTVDRLVREALEVDYEACPETWKRVKAQLHEDEDGFVAFIRAHVAARLGR